MTSKEYTKILSGDLSLHTYKDFKQAVEAAYSQYDFQAAQKGMYKILNADFKELIDYYSALKVCFYFTNSSDNLRVPLQQLFDQKKMITCLKIACGLNLAIILYLLPNYAEAGALPYLILPINLIAFFLLGQVNKSKRVIMCTSCLQFTLENYGNDRRFCLRCKRDLRANLKEESLSHLKRRIENGSMVDQSAKTEFNKLSREMSEFVGLFEQEKSIEKAFLKMKYNSHG